MREFARIEIVLKGEDRRTEDGYKQEYRFVEVHVDGLDGVQGRIAVKEIINTTSFTTHFDNLWNSLGRKYAYELKEMILRKQGNAE